MHHQIHFIIKTAEPSKLFSESQLQTYGELISSLADDIENQDSWNPTKADGGDLSIHKLYYDPDADSVWFVHYSPFAPGIDWRIQIPARFSDGSKIERLVENLYCWNKVREVFLTEKNIIVALLEFGGAG